MTTPSHPSAPAPQPVAKAQPACRQAASGLVAVLCGGALAMAAFTAWSDPYGLFRDQGVRYRPALDEHSRLVKAHRITAVEPQVLIVGSSRAEVGLDPTNPLLVSRGRVYNAALVDSSLYEMRRMVQHGIAVGDISLLVVGIDFEHVVGEQTPRSGWREPRLAVNARGWSQPLHAYADTGTALWSQSALLAARRTSPRRDQGNGRNRWFQSGFGTGMDSYAEERTWRGAFVHRELGEILGRLGGIMAEESDAFGRRRREAAAVHELRLLLATARDHGVALRLYHSPVHARFAELYQSLGFADQWHRWRVITTALVAEAAAMDRDWDVQLFDFSGYTSATTEAVPADTHGRMANYWEDSHFTPRVGNWMLEVMVGDPQHAPADMGVRLLPSTLDAHLAAETQAREQWNAHSRDARELRAVIAFLQHNSHNRLLVTRAMEQPLVYLIPWLDQYLQDETTETPPTP